MLFQTQLKGDRWKNLVGGLVGGALGTVAMMRYYWKIVTELAGKDRVAS